MFLIGQLIARHDSMRTLKFDLMDLGYFYGATNFAHGTSSREMMMMIAAIGGCYKGGNNAVEVIVKST